MRIVRSALFTLSAIACMSVPAAAQLVYDNGAPDGTGGSEMSIWLQADNFTLRGDATISSVRFWAFQVGPDSYKGSVFWQILNNAGTQPGTSVLATGSADPTRTGAGMYGRFQQYQYDFSISPLALSSGTYYLALHNGPLVPIHDGPVLGSDFQMYWSTAADNGTSHGARLQSPFDGGWNVNSGEFAFALYGDTTQSVVPEPAIMALTGTGLLLLGLGAHRRRSRKG